MAGPHGPNFTDAENFQLCASCINTSIDPVTGNSQMQATYWKCITVDFMSGMRAAAEKKAREDEEEVVAVVERSMHLLQTRWTAIQGSVSKFSGCWAKIMARNASGNKPYHENVNDSTLNI
ncbi:hypothetical protein BJV82DRAFT_509341 [Fennellomyces sp. T-0311]|nr:hypothetical protein BJV82DRAFT_509341 [Fennellomyces sp. T-0311]